MEAIFGDEEPVGRRDFSVIRDLKSTSIKYRHTSNKSQLPCQRSLDNTDDEVKLKKHFCKTMQSSLLTLQLNHRKLCVLATTATFLLVCFCFGSWHVFGKADYYFASSKKIPGTCTIFIG